MMSIAGSVDFTGWSGLRVVRVVRVADECVIITDGYEDKASAEANVESAKATFATMAELMPEEPFVREGEIVWAVNADDQSTTPGYVRNVFVDFDPVKYDALMTYFDTTTERFREVPGLIRVRLGRILENRMAAMAVYDNKASANAGQGNMRAIMAGMAEFVTGDYNIREREVVLSYNR